MQASKLTLSPEMLEAINKPGLTRKQKTKLRVNAIKDFIRSQPVGTPLSVKEIVEAGGYQSYGSGSVAVSKFIKKGFISRHKSSESYKSVWSIPGDANVVVPPLPKEDWHTPENVERKIDELPEVETPILGDAEDMELGRDMAFIIRVQKAAMTFAWKDNSDSLREFVKSLK